MGIIQTIDRYREKAQGSFCENNFGSYFLVKLELSIKMNNIVNIFIADRLPCLFYGFGFRHTDPVKYNTLCKYVKYKNFNLQL